MDSNSTLLHRDSVAGAVARAIEHFPGYDFENCFATLCIAQSGALALDQRTELFLDQHRVQQRDAHLMRSLCMRVSSSEER